MARTKKTENKKKLLTDFIDYAEIDIPKGKKPIVYKFYERRAEILRDILDLGHPSLYNRTKAGRYYGVTPGQISHDIQALKEYLSKTVSKDAKAISNVVYTAALRGYMKTKQWEKAVKVLDSMNSFLFDTGGLRKTPQEVNFKGKATLTHEDFAAALAASKAAPKEAAK